MCTNGVSTPRVVVDACSVSLPTVKLGSDFVYIRRSAIVYLRTELV